MLSVVRNWYMVPWDKLGRLPEVTYRFRNGAKLYCRSQSTDINEACVVFSGLEYPTELCRLDPTAKREAVVLDLGGNIGAFTVWLAAINPATPMKVFAFEPHPGNAELMRRNCTLNRIEGVEVLEKAVAGEAGHVRLDISGGFDAFRIDSAAADAIEVEAITLRDFLDGRGIGRVDLLKMDIEGAEYGIVESDVQTLAERVGMMILEFHGPPESAPVQDMVRSLDAFFDVRFEDQHSGGGVISCRPRNVGVPAGMRNL